MLVVRTILKKWATLCAMLIVIFFVRHSPITGKFASVIDIFGFSASEFDLSSASLASADSLQAIVIKKSGGGFTEVPSVSSDAPAVALLHKDGKVFEVTQGEAARIVARVPAEGDAGDSYDDFMAVVATPIAIEATASSSADTSLPLPVPEASAPVLAEVSIPVVVPEVAPALAPESIAPQPEFAPAVFPTPADAPVLTASILGAFWSHLPSWLAWSPVSAPRYGFASVLNSFSDDDAAKAIAAGSFDPALRTKVYSLSLPVLGNGKQVFRVFSDASQELYDGDGALLASSNPLFEYQDNADGNELPYKLVKTVSSYVKNGQYVVFVLTLSTAEGDIITARYVYGYDGEKYRKDVTYGIMNASKTKGRKTRTTGHKVIGRPMPDAGTWVIAPAFKAHFGVTGIDQFYHKDFENGAVNIAQKSAPLVGTKPVGTGMMDAEILEDSTNRIVMRANGIIHTIYFSGKMYAYDEKGGALVVRAVAGSPAFAFVVSGTTYMLDLTTLNPEKALITARGADFKNPATPKYTIGSSGGVFSPKVGSYPMSAIQEKNLHGQMVDKVEFYLDGSKYPRYYPVFEVSNWISKSLPDFYGEVDHHVMQNFEYIISFKDNIPGAKDKPATLIFQYLGVVAGNTFFYLDPLIGDGVASTDPSTEGGYYNPFFRKEIASLAVQTSLVASPSVIPPTTSFQVKVIASVSGRDLNYKELGSLDLQYGRCDSNDYLPIVKTTGEIRLLPSSLTNPAFFTNDISSIRKDASVDWTFNLITTPTAQGTYCIRTRSDQSFVTNAVTQITIQSPTTISTTPTPVISSPAQPQPTIIPPLPTPTPQQPINRTSSYTVSNLQDFLTSLIQQNAGSASVALAVYIKTNGTTDTIGKLTKAALVEWQKANDLTASGYFGVLTRKYMREAEDAGEWRRN